MGFEDRRLAEGSHIQEKKTKILLVILSRSLLFNTVISVCVTVLLVCDLKSDSDKVVRRGCEAGWLRREEEEEGEEEILGQTREEFTEEGLHDVEGFRNIM